MDEIRIFSYSSRIKGFRKANELSVIDMGDTEVNCTALKMKTVACHSPSNPPQIFIILMGAVSGYDMHLPVFADIVLDIAEKVDDFRIDGFYLIGIMTPHQIVDLIHGVRIIGAGRIIFNIESFAGMDVIKIEYSFLVLKPEDVPAVTGKGNKRHRYYEIPSRHHGSEILLRILPGIMKHPGQATARIRLLIVPDVRIPKCASHHNHPSPGEKGSVPRRI